MTRTTGWALGWNVARAVAAVAIAAAVVAQFISSASGAAAAGRDIATTVANFFSFFTILSNVSAAVVLLLLAVRHLRRRRSTRDGAEIDPRALATALAYVSTYMIVTGVVYNLLLRGLPLQPETVGWSNEILHVWGPLFLLLDVLLGAGRRRLPWTAALGAAVFPIAWIVYTLLRAPLITNPTTGAPYWYPYPFLDPNTGGWSSVMVYIVVIAVAIVALAFGIVAIGRARGIRMPRDPSV